LSKWQEKVGAIANLGIDNIYLKVERPADFADRVKPMLNIGGLVKYPRGKGGIILCNLLFKGAEQMPANIVHKQNVLAAILRNLNAPFAGGKTIIAGASNLKYDPSIDLSKQATQYRTDRGWFGDSKFTFADLPTGRQKLGGVPYDIYEFATSPVPTAVMLTGSGVPNKLPSSVEGIPVNKKADALFFLHTARIGQHPSAKDLAEKKVPELFHYVIHYADGQTETLPIVADIDIGDYKVNGDPKPLPGAQIAWSAPYQGTAFTAIAYARQWTNPRPDVTITSIDMTYPDSN
jgi:beta-galactosidase